MMSYFSVYFSCASVRHKGSGLGKSLHAFQKISSCTYFHNDSRLRRRASSEKERPDKIVDRTEGQEKQERNVVSFESLLTQSREQARCSVVVQTSSSQSSKDLANTCSQYGRIKKMFYYTVASKNFILVEFASKHEVRKLLDHTRHINDQEVIPAYSPFLWLKAHDSKASSAKRALSELPDLLANPVASEPELHVTMQKANSIDEQMQILCSGLEMTDVARRLRFLTCYQVETALSGIFPHALVLPFGSSINGYGKNAADLDMVLSLDGRKEHVLQSDTDQNGSRHFFQAKPAYANGRLQVQRHMELLGDILQGFVPGCVQIKRILQARVPIVKYQQEFTGLECDLSMSNLTGLYMSELLYIYGCCDPRVKPLVFTIRHWAKAARITSPVPGRWVTNFSLTLLVLYFLQSRPKPILSPLNYLIQKAGSSDHRITEGINCTYLRDIHKIPSSENTETCEELLFEFFRFIESFSFRDKGISLVWGQPLTKPEYSPLYIQNPLERELNVSKNVSVEEIERLVSEARSALWRLEADPEPPNSPEWGILALLQTGYGQTTKAASSVAANFEVRSLFHGEDGEVGREEAAVANAVPQVSQTDTKRTVSQVKSAEVRRIAISDSKLLELHFPPLERKATEKKSKRTQVKSKRSSASNKGNEWRYW